MATSTAAITPGTTVAPKRRLGGDEVAYLITLIFATAILLVTVAIV